MKEFKLGMLCGIIVVGTFWIGWWFGYQKGHSDLNRLSSAMNNIHSQISGGYNLEEIQK